MPAEVVETFLHGERTWYARCVDCPAHKPSSPGDNTWTSLFHNEEDAICIAGLHNTLHHTPHTKSALKR